MRFSGIPACLTGTLFLAAIAVEAPAALIDSVSGEGYFTVVDDVNQLEWLAFSGGVIFDNSDLANQTFGLSPNQALANFGGDGFHWATSGEVNLFLGEYFQQHPHITVGTNLQPGLTPTTPPVLALNQALEFVDGCLDGGVCGPDEVDFDQMPWVIDLLGINASFGAESIAFYDDSDIAGPSDNSQNYIGMDDSSSPSFYQGEFDLGATPDGDRISSTVAVWMVRPIPEPDVAILASIGLLTLLRRRSRP